MEPSKRPKPLATQHFSGTGRSPSAEGEEGEVSGWAVGEVGELEPRGGGRSAVQLCFPEPGISLCLTDMWTFTGEKVRGEKKEEGEKEKQNEDVSVMTVEVTKAQTDSKKKRRAGFWSAG